MAVFWFSRSWRALVVRLLIIAHAELGAGVLIAWTLPRGLLLVVSGRHRGQRPRSYGCPVVVAHHHLPAGANRLTSEIILASSCHQSSSRRPSTSNDRPQDPCRSSCWRFGRLTTRSSADRRGRSWPNSALLRRAHLGDRRSPSSVFRPSARQAAHRPRRGESLLNDAPRSSPGLVLAWQPVARPSVPQPQSFDALTGRPPSVSPASRPRAQVGLAISQPSRGSATLPIETTLTTVLFGPISSPSTGVVLAVVGGVVAHRRPRGRCHRPPGSSSSASGVPRLPRQLACFPLIRLGVASVRSQISRRSPSPSWRCSQPRAVVYGLTGWSTDWLLRKVSTVYGTCFLGRAGGSWPGARPRAAATVGDRELLR
jgi:hypothetical protein